MGVSPVLSLNLKETTLNHLKAYISLCRKRQSDILPAKDNHKHHIFPKSIYGNNNYLVILTTKEHFIAHRLLHKAFEKRYGVKHNKTIKMLYAIARFSSNFSKNSRQYSIACKSSSKARLGSKTSTDTKKKLSIIRSGSNHHMFGKHHSDETKLKIRNKRTGHKASQESKDNQSKALKGKKQTTEVCKMRSESAKKTWGELKENGIYRGSKRTEEVKIKDSLKAKERWATPGYREKIAATKAAKKSSRSK